MKHPKELVKDYLRKKDFHQRVVQEREELKVIVTRHATVLNYNWFAKPGHFYSPLIDGKERDFPHLVDLRNPKYKTASMPGINVDKQAQFALLEKLSKHTKNMAGYLRIKGIRFDPENDQYGSSDAGVLFAMLQHIKPKKVIEVGSGWSSALMMDVNDHFTKKPAGLTFIEPYPQRLFSALKRGDRNRCEIIEKKVQSVEPRVFQKLDENDVLFIDNSHVTKSGSDVNYLFFEILPQLKKGVLIHIHDIFYPFEYPLQWIVDDRRNWNEAYVLRALLINNEAFEIILWPSFLTLTDKAKFRKLVPHSTDLGSSIWLRKVR